MTTQQIGFPQLVQDYFLRRLVQQRGASNRTVESYRDTFRLLFGFIEQRTGRPASALQLADLDAPLVLDFLEHLENDRGNTARTRNARLAAIHSFMRYAALRDPASLPITARVLAIPAKRFDRPILGYLTREQVAAILAAPNRATWSGHRDAVLFTTAYNTGARVSELTGLKVRDVLLDRETAVHLHGKGRKQRAIPLWKNTATELRGWLNRISPAPDAPVFPNRAGAPLTRSGVQDRLNRAVAAAEQHCPSLNGQHISPHTLRHSTAMHLLQSGTWPSSPYGSGIPTQQSRTNTSKRISPRKKPSCGDSPIQAQPHHDSSPATSSSRSYKASDYAQLTNTKPPR